MTPTAAFRGLRIVVALSAATSASACGPSDGSPGPVVPPPIIIDTFEDGGSQPMDPRFTHWAYGPTDIGDAHSPMVQPGYQSNWALGLNWQFTDPPDGVLNYLSVVEFTDPVASIDLTGYTRFSFAFFYEHSGDCAAADTISIILGCSVRNVAFQAYVPVSPTWTVAEMPLDEFGPSYSPPPNGTLREDCFKIADSVVVQPNTSLADGQCASGNLVIDNVMIE